MKKYLKIYYFGILWYNYLEKINKSYKGANMYLLILLLAVILVTRSVKAVKYKIRTQNGIQKSTFVELGGIKQFIQIRGKDTNNPIIIFLHGGPGSPMSYVSYYYQPELEKDYTIVNWDQRGCGRTYYANPNMDVKTELSTDILLNDLDDLADYLMKRFGKDKVIIIGHSWGTFLGTLYVKQHPEKVSAYIGVSQSVDLRRGIILAANKALENTTLNDNKNKGKLSTSLDKFIKTENYNSLDPKSLMQMLSLSENNLSYDGKMSGLKQMWVGLTSPYFSLEDARWFTMPMKSFDNLFKLEASLFEDSLWNINLNKQSKEYKVPVYFISGESDWRTPTVMVEDYYKSVETPKKDMIVIKNAGHSPFMDNPEDFCKAVKTALSRYHCKVVEL